jgi:putative chromate ion transporter
MRRSDCYHRVGVAKLAAVRELSMRTNRHDGGLAATLPFGLIAGGAVSLGTIGSLIWVAFKVGALSYGGGFVIIPLMQADAVNRYHWMTNSQFLSTVALGQVTPDPVVQTVSAVGHAAAGVVGGLIAAIVVFTPSFTFVLLGGNRFEQLRAKQHVRAFLDGAGPAAIGGIIGAGISLASALTEPGNTAFWLAPRSCCSCCAEALSLPSLPQPSLESSLSATEARSHTDASPPCRTHAGDPAGLRSAAFMSRRVA